MLLTAVPVAFKPMQTQFELAQKTTFVHVGVIEHRPWHWHMKADCDVVARDAVNWKTVAVFENAVPYTLPLLFAVVEEKSRIETGALQAQVRSEVGVAAVNWYWAKVQKVRMVQILFEKEVGGVDWYWESLQKETGEQTRSEVKVDETVW